MGSSLHTCWVCFHAALGMRSTGCLAWDLAFQEMSPKKSIPLPKISVEASFSQTVRKSLSCTHIECDYRNLIFLGDKAEGNKMTTHQHGARTGDRHSSPACRDRLTEPQRMGAFCHG